MYLDTRAQNYRHRSEQFRATLFVARMREHKLFRPKRVFFPTIFTFTFGHSDTADRRTNSYSQTQTHRHKTHIQTHGKVYSNLCVLIVRHSNAIYIFVRSVCVWLWFFGTCGTHSCIKAFTQRFEIDCEGATDQFMSHLASHSSMSLFSSAWDATNAVVVDVLMVMIMPMITLTIIRSLVVD